MEFLLLRKVPALQFHFILVSKCKQREGNQREQTPGASKQAQRTLEAPGTKTLPVIPLRGDFLQVEFLNSDFDSQISQELLQQVRSPSGRQEVGIEPGNQPDGRKNTTPADWRSRTWQPEPEQF